MAVTSSESMCRHCGWREATTEGWCEYCDSVLKRGQVKLSRVETRPRNTYQARPGAELSPRETEVLQLLAAGADYDDIRKSLGIGLGTVSAHIARIKTKARAGSMFQLGAWHVERDEMRAAAAAGVML